MKKVLLGILVIAAMTGCVKDQVVSSRVPGVIAFEDVWVEKAYTHRSRAAVDPSTTTATIESFDVWGFMTKPTGLVFDQKRVERRLGENGEYVWSYDEFAYWASNRTYYFAALSPVDNENIKLEMADAANNTMAENGALGTIKFTTPDGKLDLLYAQPDPITIGDSTTDRPTSVKLNFAHLLSKVKFAFKNGFESPYNDVKVTNIKMWVPKSGSVDLTQSARPYLWNIDSFDNTICLEFGDITANNPEEGADNTKLRRQELGECEQEYLILPVKVDAANPPQIKITFDVVLYQGTEEATKIVGKSSILVFDGTGKGLDRGMEQGVAYRLYAELNEKNIDENPLLPIDFTVTVDEWADGDDSSLDIE